jgi:hypothetical protein
LANLGRGGDRSKPPIDGLTTRTKAASLLNVGTKSVERAKKVQSEAQAGIPKAEKERPATTCGDTLRDHAAETVAKTSTAKATASQTNRGAVERMDHLRRERPDLAVLELSTGTAAQ